MINAQNFIHILHLVLSDGRLIRRNTRYEEDLHKNGTKKNAMCLKSKTKLMLINFFDIHDIVHAKFLPRGQTIYQNICKNIL